MDDGLFRCRGCGRFVTSRSDNQQYCGRQHCQRARKNAWRREKYAADSDYRANQRDSSARWMESQGGVGAYFRDYRRRRQGRPSPPTGPVVASTKDIPQPHDDDERPRETTVDNEESGSPQTGLSERRAALRGHPESATATPAARANSDATVPEPTVVSGTYRLTPCGSANSDAILVNLSVISTGSTGMQISTS